ncbi:MAG: DNA polymerase III subunit beta, partial [Candidatus Omnitrophica bacterium]|nr:DNA polymerase III subunit beta [Candidatus Omnitrophota bacterium]
FVKGIHTVQNVISQKSNLPILSYLLIEAREDNIHLTTTDLDIGITCEIPANIEEAGMIVLPAKKFGDIIKEFPDNTINIETRKNNLTIINSKQCQFKLMGLPFEEFPKLPKFTNQEIIKFRQDELKKMLSLISFAVSYDETRYILNGILCQIEKDNISLVATDGKRLAFYQSKLLQGVNKSIEMIIPVKAIHELNRNLSEEGELLLGIGSNQILLDFGKTQIISRLIEGEFPDYKQIIPSVSPNKIKIDREQLLLAIKRASLLVTPDYQAVKLEVLKNKLVISKSTPDVGESREELTCEHTGKDMIIGFNPNYLIDVLKNLEDETIELEMSDSEKPGVIRSNGYIYIVLPMRLV